MNKKVVKYAACCLASGMVLSLAAMGTFANGESTNVSTQTGESYTVAGLSFSFGRDNSVISYVESERAAAEAAAAAALAEQEAISANEVQQVTTEYTNIAVAQVNDYVNIRDCASEDGEILGKLYDESAANVLAVEGDWYQIQSGSVTGYVKAEFVVRDDEELCKSVRKRIARVTTETLRVRKEASVDAKILDLVAGGEDIKVTDESIEGWTKVVVGDDEGYVSNEFIEIRSEYVQAESIEEERARLKAEEEARKKVAAQRAASSSRKSGGSSSYSAPAGNDASDVVSFALQFVGNPYVWGGTSLTNGADCSGFTMAVYSNFGVYLPHSSRAQRSCGYSVGDLSEAKPGDIICQSGHVGLYIGGGQMVHASTESTGIIVSSVNYYLDIRRVY